MPRIESERLNSAESRQKEDRAAGPLAKRLSWFAFYWFASVAILAVVAYGIRLAIL
ncbi:DUF2474 family protein [Fulvimarina sp. MAC8]|uniref:DUF2474 family protein n=1 Tax=Fulvimarina sp. MAC8 TaxID=3162874 RepID=UPI0032EFD4DA